MFNRWLALTMGMIASPAHACIDLVPLSLGDIKFADVVVVGRIERYQIVPDAKARQQYQRMVAKRPYLGKLSSRPRGFVTDYARFEVVVGEVLRGKVTKRFTATWDASTFAEPERAPSGLLLIALRYPNSKSPPLRGASATIFPNREPRSLTVLQAPCSAAFLFQAGGSQANAIRKMLKQRTF